MKPSFLLPLAILLAACSSSTSATDGPAHANPGSGAVIDRIQLIGLPVGAGQVLSAEDLGFLHATPAEGTAFEISLCNGCSGRVFVFSDVSTMEIAMARLQDEPLMGDSHFSWLFPYGRVLLQLDGRVSREWASQYQDALYSLAWAAD